MDGVIADFDGYFKSAYPAEKNLRSAIVRHFDEFVSTNGFLKLHLTPEANILMKACEATGAVIEILSSGTSNTAQFHDIAAQKHAWLANQGIKYKTHVVPGGLAKGKYANEHTLLIDDTRSVVEHFINCGGNAIRHSMIATTLRLLKEYSF